MTSVALGLAALVVAFANGANDNFKGVATLHGSGRLSYRKALALATLTTLAGSLTAILMASGLARRFSGRGLVPDAALAAPGFLPAVAIGAAVTLLLATRLGFPISTTHALTGGLVGAGLVAAGRNGLSYWTLGNSFFAPLLLSPLVALLLAAALHAALTWAGERLGAGEPACVCVVDVPELATARPGGSALSLRSGALVMIDTTQACRRHPVRLFLNLGLRPAADALHLLSAGAVGFARGLNDTPKIAGLVVGAQMAGLNAGTGALAAAMAIGGLLAARRVARTLSFGITGMNALDGLSANLVTASLVMLASPLGLPVSTTHVSCGALFGIGAVNGRARSRIITQILAAWLITLPLAAALAGSVAFWGTLS